MAGSPLRILLIRQDSRSLRRISDILGNFGRTEVVCQEAPTSTEDLGAVTNGLFDLIIAEPAGFHLDLLQHAAVIVVLNDNDSTEPDPFLSAGALEVWQDKDLTIEDVRRTLRYIRGFQERIQDYRESLDIAQRDRNLYRALASNIPNGTAYLLDLEGRILLVEGHGLHQLGLTGEAVLGKTVQEVFGQDEAMGNMEAALNRAADGHEVLFEVEMRGRIREVRVAPIFEENQVVAVMALTQDITIRRRSEEALRQSEATLALAQSVAHLGSLEIDAVTHQSHWSDEAFRILGYQPQAFEPSPQRLLDRVHPDDVAIVREHAKEFFKHEQPFDFQHRIIRPDGEVRLVHSRAEVIYDSNRRPARFVSTLHDITERRNVEEQRDRFFALAQEMFCIAGRDGYFKQVNPAWERIMGYTEHELLSTPYLELVHPDDRLAAIEHLNKMDFGTGAFHLENRYRCRNGSYKWIHWSSTFSADKRLIYAVATDITERKEAEAALLSSHDVLEARVRERTAELEHINQSLHAEAAERQMAVGALREIVTELEHAKENLEQANQELTTNETRLIQGNRIFADLARLRVTIQEELDQALHQITESLSELVGVERCSIWLFNDDRSAIQCIDLYEAVAQAHSSGATLYEHEYPDYFRSLGTQRTIIADDAHTHSATREFSAGYLKPLGISSMLDMAILLDGQTIGVLCCEHVGPPREWEVEDETFVASAAALCSLTIESHQRARAEEALRHAKEEAERANLAKSEFLSRMSHELRTPMNSILGFAQLMEMHHPTGKEAQRIAHILKAGRHLLQMIDEVLDIARVESGRLSLSSEPTPVRTTLQSAIDLIRPLCAQLDLRVIDEIGACGELFVQADQQRLSQVLLNLLSNATKYNRKGGEVRVRCEIRSPEILRISIEDTGIGIPAQYLPRLFQPFDRLGAENGEVQGTGLGLALSKRLMEAMGGSLDASSVAGEGSIFWMDLPLTKPVQLEDLDVQSFAEPEIAGSESLVLYIEDNLANLQVIEGVLENHANIRLLSAMQGQIGLDLAREHQPSLILLDLHLPDIPGEEVLRRLRAEPLTRDIPIVVISADATQKQIRRLLEAGADKYLTKPLDVREFLSVVQEILRVHETEHLTA